MPARTLSLLFLTLALTSFHASEPEMPAPQALAEDPVAAVEAFFEARPSGLDGMEIARLAPVVVAEARRVGLPPGMVLAVIEVESGGRIRARSAADARGLMQILPTTGQALASELGVPWQGAETLYDPETNVRLGVVYLARLRDRFGDMPTALAAYNAGPTRIARMLAHGQPVPRGYARRVLSAWPSPPPRPI